MMVAKSKAHRTRMVPNWNYNHHQQPSSSMTARTVPSHFFKIILPSTMQQMKLMIPEKFVREFGNELSTVAKLTVTHGHIWQVGLEKADKSIWFCDGWKDFAEYHCICYGYFLVFRYEGNSNFHVLVFDKTATEIQYPLSKHCNLEDQVEIVELDDAYISMHDKLNENEIFNSKQFPSKYEEVKEKFVKKKISGTSSKGELMMSRGGERAIQAARTFKPKNPSFMGIIQLYNISNRYMYVPAGFAFKYLRQRQIAKLETSDGRQWPVNCYYREPSSSAMNIGRGWIVFARENNLEEGDVCVFELIKRKPVVLNVSIFRVVDYAHNALLVK
ncbi:B3 domain-containing transcription factor VRN1-like [Quercus robur]|uniref:B3 domain-containing transcription factor VRN1-like n=1 Tax=Quercus robur TaxID=38942 RepID=UPI0021627053|nr:B3 domain-containing transcription factor VRN1-like [Quercus robur]